MRTRKPGRVAAASFPGTASGADDPAIAIAQAPRGVPGVDDQGGVLDDPGAALPKATQIELEGQLIVSMLRND